MQRLISSLFALAWLFVIFVSVIDGYLLHFHRDVIVDHELNPVGLALLAIEGGEVWLFLLLKFLGTLLACTALTVIYRSRPRIGLIIAMSMACFQFWLLIFLSYA